MNSKHPERAHEYYTAPGNPNGFKCLLLAAWSETLAFDLPLIPSFSRQLASPTLAGLTQFFPEQFCPNIYSIALTTLAI